MTKTQRLTSSESHELADIVRALGAREVLHLLKNYQQGIQLMMPKHDHLLKPNQ